jgi:hypothetical protein
MERVYRFFVGVGNYTGAKKVIALFPQKDILNRLHDHFIERKDTNFQGDSSPMTVFLSYVLDPEKEFTPVTVDLKEIDFLKRFFDCDVLNARINKVLGKKRSRKKVKRKEKEKNSSESNTSVTKIESLGSFDFIDDLSKPKNTDNIITDSFSNLLPKFDETVNEEIKVIDLKTGSHEDEASLSNEIDKKYENSANNSLDSSTEDLSPEFENFCSPDSFKKSYSKEEIIELEKTEDFKRFLERKFGK